MDAMKTILLAVDFSDSSDAAVERAIGLANPQRALWEPKVA